METEIQKKNADIAELVRQNAPKENVVRVKTLPKSNVRRNTDTE